MAGGPYRSKNGWYHIVWSRRGKKTKEALKTKNIQEARKRKAQLESKFFDGTHDPFEKKWYEENELSEVMPVSVAAEQYISHKLEQKGRRGWKTESTYSSHSIVIRLFEKFLGSTPVGRIDKEAVHKFLHQKGINSRYTRVSYKSKIDGFLNWCKERGYIDEVPAVEVNQPQSRVVEYVPDAKLQEVFDKLEGWYGDWCRFAVDSGLRPIEVRNIQISDITESDIYVGKSFRTKTNTARKVPLIGKALEVAEKYKDTDFRQKRSRLKNTPLLFGRCSNYDIKKMNDRLKKACNESGCPELTAKELRHLFAIRYLLKNKERDFGLLRLMQVMGHTNLETTQNYLSYLPTNNKL